MNYTNIITTFFLIIATFQFAEAKDLMIKVPVKCIKFPSCGDDISLSDAKKSYAQVLIEKKECLDEIKKSKKRLDGISSPSSLLGKYKLGNLVPDKKSCTLEVAAFNNTCGKAYTTGFYHDWAPSEYYSNGNEVLTEIIKRVSDGIVFDSKVIVETITSTPKERHLALCKVREIGGLTGPPRECVTVAIITPTEKWLRGRDPNITRCPASASFRRSGAINIDFKVETKLKPHNFSSNIISMLTDSLGLFTDQEIESSSDGEMEYIYIQAAGGLRNSLILKNGWREVLDFDISIHSRPNGLGIRGTAHALVSRQALGNIIEYQGLNDAQRSKYADSLDSNVANAIKTTCGIYKKIDSKNILCQ